MRRLLILASLLALGLAQAAALTQAEAKALFAEANESFQAGNEAAAGDPSSAHQHYRGAALRYERLIDEGGLANGKLYYNLGNAYFRMGDIGRAILNYRRALRLRPGDENIRRNLDYARSQRLDRIEDSSSDQALHTLLFWHYDLSPSTRWTLFAVAWIAVWGLAAMRLKRPRFVSSAVLAVVGFIAVALGTSVAASSFGATDNAGVITELETVARKGDARSYAPAFEQPLHAGLEFKLLEARRDWLHVELPDGRTAWVEASAAELL